MPDTVQIEPADALPNLRAKLIAYQAVSGKTASAVLLQKGAQLIYGNSNRDYGATFPGLVKLFQRETPPRESIAAQALARGFRLGRRNFASSESGISQTAYDRATRVMGGGKSVLATGEGVDLSFVRRGVRGRRVHLRNGRTSYAVDASSSLRREGDKVLNFRAVATYFELQIREAGRGYLGAAWLFSRFRRFAQSDPRRQATGTFRFIASVNPRARLQLQAEAELSGDADAGNVTLRLSTFVPGEAAVGNARGLFGRAMASVSADIGAYLARKEREAALAALGGSAA